MAEIPGDKSRLTHPVEHSDQQIQNHSYDRDFQIAAREICGYEPGSDTLKRIVTDSLGRLCVVIKGTDPVTSIWDEQSTTTLAANTLTTVYTRTVVTKALLIDNISVTGTVDAEFRVLIDSTVVERKCTSEQNRNADFIFPMSQEIAVGSVIEVKVIHAYDGTDKELLTGDFYVSLKGHKN